MMCRVIELCSRALRVRARRPRRAVVIACAAIAVAGLGIGRTAGAAVIFDRTLTGTSPVDGKQLSAHVVFDVSGDTLKVTATNTGTAATVPSDVLTGVLFDLSRPESLHPMGVDFTTTAGNNKDQLLNSAGAEPLGRHWAFSQFASPVGGQDYGLGASGLGGTFGHANFATPGDALQGVDYGIVDGLGTRPNGGVQVPLVSRSLTFTLGGLAAGAAPDVIGVRLQYGSNLTEPFLGYGTAVPEPTMVGVIGLSALFMGQRRRRS